MYLLTKFSQSKSRQTESKCTRQKRNEIINRASAILLIAFFWLAILRAFVRWSLKKKDLNND